MCSTKGEEVEQVAAIGVSIHDAECARHPSETSCCQTNARDQRVCTDRGGQGILDHLQVSRHLIESKEGLHCNDVDYDCQPQLLNEAHHQQGHQEGICHKCEEDCLGPCAQTNIFDFGSLRRNQPNKPGSWGAVSKGS